MTRPDGATRGSAAIDGIGEFEGVTLHGAPSARRHEIEGRRVAVICEGGSGIRLVPELARRARALKVFQRAAPFILPRLGSLPFAARRASIRESRSVLSPLRDDSDDGADAPVLEVGRASPSRKALELIARLHARHAIEDRWLRRQLTPDPRAADDRFFVSSEYYPAFERPNVKLLGWPIVRVRREGVQTAEGIVHAFDCIVFAASAEPRHSHRWAESTAQRADHV